MTTGNGPKLTVSQGYEVLEPRSGPAYPVPCSEWDYLRDRLKKVEHAPWFFHAAGFTLLGAAASNLIGLLIGGPDLDENKARVIAWAAMIVCAILGVAFLFLHRVQLGVNRQAVADVLQQMEVIERRYERRGEG